MPVFEAIDNPAIRRGPEGTSVTATFAITLNPASDKTETVKAATRDFPTLDGMSADQLASLAHGGTDYEPVSEVLTFAPGETRKTLDVTVHGSNVRHMKLFCVELSEGSQDIRRKEGAGIITTTG